MNMTFRPIIPATSIQPYCAFKSFMEAAGSYMKHGGDRKHLPKILPLIGATSLDKIFSFDVAQLTKEFFPAHINSIRSGCWMLLLLANREITRPTLTVHKPSHQHPEHR